ncbi:bifunctional preprotein translocase subunit SecD/SecF [Mycoplasmopsis californica]|uniref:Protein translocase subunit SecF n=1 Tax=Mycoplasmopsis equigenitalium TaxID=114883 RepID=A0ABY5J5D9_9BACT|nr:protein translocase subunit SecDF [Mycoplasmopsis equigenitalium]UUD37180.1 protein translocase subunit SecDF [Mycoplasmopsis equigenitalium]VEU69514.1 bifunctional preprotein translocase subunit SecD/SecF [Mycoplasmopsis californica]
MNKIKKFFSLNSWKRWVILSLTFITTIISIVFGSVFFVSKNINKSIEYGGGIQAIVQVVNKESANPEDVDPALVETVSESINTRLNGGNGLNGIKTTIGSDGKIRVTKNGSISESQIQEFINQIISKPQLTMTDTKMQPLFIDGVFNYRIKDSSDPANKIDYKNLSKYTPPIQSGSVKALLNQDGSNYLSLDLKDDGQGGYEVEWTKATEYMSQTQDRTILMWINLDTLVQIAKTSFPKEWKNAKENPYNFVYVNETPTITAPPGAQDYSQVIRPLLKENAFNAKNFLISSATVSQPLHGKSFTISGSFTNQEANQLALNINYGTAKYDLKFISSSIIAPNSSNVSNFDHAIIAGVVVLILIAVFMIANYGLLGVLSTLSMSLYIFLTLLLFSALNGEYSPATIASLVIGIGLSVDANIITYERLKNEHYNGDSLVKATRNSHRFSLSSILDANITTLIITVVLFFFGSINVKSFSISLMISIMFTLFVMLVFNKLLATLLVNITTINKRPWLFGIWKKQKHQVENPKTPFYKKIDYVKVSNYMFIVSFSIIAIAIVAFVVLSIINKNVFGAFELSVDFSGGSIVSIESSGGEIPLNDNLNIRNATNIKNEVIKIFASRGIDIANDTKIVQKDVAGTNYAIEIRTAKDIIEFLNDKTNNGFEKILGNKFIDLKVANYSISQAESIKIVNNVMLSIGISFIGIIIYTLIRMRWTYSIAAIIALLHDILFVAGSFVVLRLELSPIIIAAMLSIVAFSINDTIVIFDRIRETLNTEYATKIINKQDLKTIINKSIGETIKRSLFTSFTTILTVLVLLAFKDATGLTFNIAMLIGLTVGTYSSIFIASQVWYRLETWRQKGIEKRKKTNYWNINKPGEQIFPGINDFKY